MVQKGRVFFDLQGISSSVKRIPLHRNNFTFSLMDFVQNEPESDYPIQNSLPKGNITERTITSLFNNGYCMYRTYTSLIRTAQLSLLLSRNAQSVSFIIRNLKSNYLLKMNYEVYSKPSLVFRTSSFFYCRWDPSITGPANSQKKRLFSVLHKRTA